MGSGDPAALHGGCQQLLLLTWLFGCSCSSPGCLAGGVSLGEKLMNTGSPSFPQTENSHSISSRVRVLCRSVILKGRNGTGETKRNFSPQGNRQCK